MSTVHLVQVGLLGSVGKFASRDRGMYRRDAQVICRTVRGLEVGKVICNVSDEVFGHDSSCDGELLRVVGREDLAILNRLEKFRDRAFSACSDLLEQRGLKATLIDVEHLFDGQSIWFYFLGPVTPEVEQLTGELAEVYEGKVKFRKFAETLANGCGPDCGTGSSCGDCGSCALKNRGCGSS